MFRYLVRVRSDLPRRGPCNGAYTGGLPRVSAWDVDEVLMATPAGVITLKRSARPATDGGVESTQHHQSAPRRGHVPGARRVCPPERGTGDRRVWALCLVVRHAAPRVAHATTTLPVIGAGT